MSPFLSEDNVRQALSGIIDPDLGRDIVSLGFVRNIRIEGSLVSLEINLTTPACPVKDRFRQQAERALLALPGVTEAKVTMTATTRGAVRQDAEAQPALAGVRNIVAVASGKGGVGKSTTAVNLAVALARTGARVGLVDADVHGPSVHLMTGAARPTHMVGDLIEPVTAHGVKVMSMGMFLEPGQANVVRGPMAGQIIMQLFTRTAWEDLDYLIVDYPPGTGDIQLTISQALSLTGVVLVTTPQEVALIDVRKAIVMFEQLQVPVLGVVETMSYFLCGNCNTRHALFGAQGGVRVAEEHGLPCLGQIPMDPRVVSGGDTGSPVVAAEPNSPAAAAYLEAAQAMAQQISILHESSSGVLQRFHIDWKPDLERMSP